MATRFIVRPSGIVTTPTMLKEALSAQRVVKAEQPGISFDPAKDFFMGYPRPALLAQGLSEGQKASYHQLYSFFVKSKYHQRKAMFEGGLQIPKTRGINLDRCSSNSLYVWRPYSHRAGEGFTVFSGGNDEPVGGYVSELFPRQWEYRVIYVFGQRVATLAKNIPATLTQEQPWTYANGATFRAINTPANTHRLHRLGFYDHADAFMVTQLAHICAYDVMVKEDAYAVSEVNFAPSLKLESRIAAVVERIKQVQP